MEDLNMFVAFVVIVFGLIQLILFFKIWGMTNNVREIKEYICKEPAVDQRVASPSVVFSSPYIGSPNTSKLYSVTITGEYMEQATVRQFEVM